MKHLLVFGHPNPDSFNHAILDTTVHALKKNGHEVIVRDLYELNFQPVLKLEEITAINAGETPTDIQIEQEFITQADVITFIYPIWWSGPPANLKGYIDRVFSYGFAYRYDDDGIIRMLTGKKGFIINTHGQPKQYYDEIGMSLSLKMTTDREIFEYVGIEPVEHLLFGSVGSLDEKAYHAMLREVDEKIDNLFPKQQ